jgi:hypothetical protein
MDGELFRELYRVAGAVASKDPPPRGTHGDFAILLTLLWAAGNDEPVSWACDRANWPLWAWRVSRRLPSPSTMSRRPHTDAFRLLLVRFNDRLRAGLPGSALKFLDGKPLLVGGFTKDRQARRGKAPGGGWARGYKLHAIVNACGAVEAFCVTPLNAGEATVAREVLLWSGACDLRGATLLADANYDSVALYAAVAAAGGRLLAPRRKPGTGLGHHGPQHPDRLAAIAALEGAGRDGPDGRAFYRLREGVEQAFGLMGNCPGGLRTGLPNHVRGLRRVRLWAMLKVILYHGYLTHQDRRRDAAA